MYLTITGMKNIIRYTKDFVIAELSRARSARSGPPWVREFGKLSIRENLVRYTEVCYIEVPMYVCYNEVSLYRGSFSYI